MSIALKMEQSLHQTTLMKRLLFLLSTAILSLAQAGPLQKASIYDLEVTQENVGFFEVDEKIDKMREMSDEELKEFIKSEPIPVVIGPKGRLYMIDHHHLARAVHETRHKTGRHHVYVDPILDLSHLSKNEFWEEMIRLKYVYLKDKGVDITPDDLP